MQVFFCKHLAIIFQKVFKNKDYNLFYVIFNPQFSCFFKEELALYTFYYNLVLKFKENIDLSRLHMICI